MNFPFLASPYLPEIILSSLFAKLDFKRVRILSSAPHTPIFIVTNVVVGGGGHINAEGFPGGEENIC